MRPAITHFSQHSIQFKSDNKLFFYQPQVKHTDSCSKITFAVSTSVCLFAVSANIMSDLLRCSDIISKYHVRPTALQ